MKVDIGVLLRGEDATPINFNYAIEKLPADVSEALMIDTESPIAIAGSITLRDRIITFAASASFEFSASCARCASPMNEKFETQVEKVIVASLENEDTDTENYIIATETVLDLDELMLEFIQLEMPMRFLCREDCAGLCQKCGADLNLGDCGCPKKEIDPRLAALSDYFKEKK